MEINQFIVTSHEDYEKLQELYAKSCENISKLKESDQIQVHHGIDGTKLETYDALKHAKYDCIIFNFPHIGGKSNVRKNHAILRGFLCSSSRLLAPRGVISITLCRGQGGTPIDSDGRGYENSWRIVEAAGDNGLILSKVCPFNPEDWPGYSPTGYRSRDKLFAVNNAFTYDFTKPWIDVSNWSGTPCNYPIVMCSGCCHNDTNTCNVPFFDGIFDDFLSYPILEQAWHPIAKAKDKLVSLLSDFFTSNNVITPPNILSSSYLTAHHSQPFNYKADWFTELVVNDRGVNLYIEQSLINRLCCLYGVHGHPITPVPWIISGPVFNHSSTVFLSTVNQLVTHQLTCLVMDYLLAVKLKEDVLIFISSILQIEKLQLLWRLGINESENLILKDDNVMVLASFCKAEINGFHSITIFLDELVTAKYKIPDVRILWSKDSRFYEQFISRADDGPFVFSPFSLFPSEFIHDVSFWIPGHLCQQEIEHQLFYLIRKVAGLNVTSARCIDTYKPDDDGNTNMTSYCYRVVYSSVDKGLGHQAVLLLQKKLRDSIETKLKWTLR
jgi:hypothetical protein